MRDEKIFPDGSTIDSWFYKADEFYVEDTSKKFLITEYGIKDDGKVYTEEFQALIDRISFNGGGILVVPKGTYISGALFFKKNVNLFIEKDGVLKGSDDISDYPICYTRIEGESCLYYPALINADGLDKFKIFGQGVIDGNGEKSWRAFWKRREWNPDCTNKDEQRPRLIFLYNCTNSAIFGVKLINSHFWTTHIYKCEKTRIIGCSFFSPHSPIAAPSTDAIDIDACTNVHIKNCVFEVNDDGIALKGGKGPLADKSSENGANERIIIEDCVYNFCHGCLTCGSESIHNKNIIVRRIKVKHAINLLWLKMRPDTPQLYENILFDDVEGYAENFVNINPWNQFFDLKGNTDIPISYARNIAMRNCKMECDTFLNVKAEESQYRLSDFVFENLIVKTGFKDYPQDAINNLVLNNAIIEKN